MNVRVSEIRKESPDAVTLKLDLMGQPFEYKPGMAVEIDPHQFEALAPLVHDLEQKKGMPEAPRGFSLASSPLDKGFIELSIKQDKPRAFPAVLTPYILEKLRIGDTIELTGPMGRYTLPEPLNPNLNGIIYIAAGSGVAPNRGIIKYCLRQHPALKHILFLQDRVEEDIFYRSEFDSLTRQNPDRLKIVPTLSRPGASWKGRKGYINLGVLREELNGFLDPARMIAFVCGPNRPSEVVDPVTGETRKRPGFLECFAGHPRKNLKGILHELGLTWDQIRTEMW